MMNAHDIARLAHVVDDAQRNARAIPKLTDEFPDMTLQDGYAVQMALRQRYLARGIRQVGWKAGLTSKAKMLQMGVDVPSIGFLMADMARDENSVVTTADLVHPRAECEIAFVTHSALSGNVTEDEVLAATAFVMPAIEIIDSRFAGFKFDLPSVVADNGSSARFVAGQKMRYFSAMDLSAIDVVMEKNGTVVSSGSSSAVMGNPAEAVALLVRVLAELGEELPADSFVMSGGITEAIHVAPGDLICARYPGFGSVSVTFV